MIADATGRTLNLARDERHMVAVMRAVMNAVCVREYRRESLNLDRLVKRLRSSEIAGRTPTSVPSLASSLTKPQGRRDRSILVADVVTVDQLLEAAMRWYGLSPAHTGLHVGCRGGHARFAREVRRAIVKKKFSIAIAIVAAVFGAMATEASAFDCIRVSSSLQGLRNSTRSGNWVLYDLSSPSAVQATAAQFGLSISIAKATCVAEHYATYGVTPYFAQGFGVAGGRTGNGPGVLAWRAPVTVLSDLRGIDHLDDSPVGQAFFGSLFACGLA